MNKLKEFFANLKRTLPVHVQWLLLFAAFLVVVILLMLLLSGPKKPAAQAQPAAKAALIIEPSEIEWRDVFAGETKIQRINISATTDIKIADVKIAGGIDAQEIGLTQRSTCPNMGVISPRVPCTITLEWKPEAALKDTGMEIQIKYHAAAQPASMATVEKLPLFLSAKAPAAIMPEEIFSPEPESEPEEFVLDDRDYAAEADYDAAILDFDYESYYEPEPAPYVPEPELPPLRIAAASNENCYEFAFAGYNLSGVQSGWIRAENGRFMYHPFSDRTCDNPTGEYNADTGLIYDLMNPMKTIGSDSERIGGRGIANIAVPRLSSPGPARQVNRARQLSAAEISGMPAAGGSGRLAIPPKPKSGLLPSSVNGGEATVSSAPYDRTFVLRQFKPIPATIVSEVRADPKNMSKLPVMATVDRNVYSDNGRTIIVPTGTLMLGYVTGELPGPYQSIGRMKINWYRFVRPDGVEFNFTNEPFSADSQGRVGVPGRGSTDYIESMIMPMMTAIVPAAVNLIAPISDKFINQIDLDNNTVTQSGQVRSSELAKQEIISTWNKVVQKLALDIMDNTTPPFSIAAGTRITVFSPTDLIVTCGPAEGSEKCAITTPSEEYAPYKSSELEPAGNTTVNYGGPDWIGQVRSFNLDGICDQNGNVVASMDELQKRGIFDFRTAAFWCQANQYQGKTQAAYDAYYQNLSSQGGITTPSGQILTKGTQGYNEQVLGLKYNEHGQILNPLSPPPAAAGQTGAGGLTCEDGSSPDGSGCCPGETFDSGVTSPESPDGSCCPDSGGYCFPPIL